MVTVRGISHIEVVHRLVAVVLVVGVVVLVHLVGVVVLVVLLRTQGR